MAGFYDLRSAYSQNAPNEELFVLYDQLLEEADEYGDTALHIAAAQADPGAVSYLLGKGVRPNQLNRYGLTPLHRLTEYRDCESHPECVYLCAKLLLEAKCSPARRDENGYCFYHRAAQKGIAPVFEALRDCKTRCNATLESTGENALHLACRAMGMFDYLKGSPAFDAEEQRFLAVVRCLLDCGLDPEDETNIGRTALDFAIENDAKRIAAVLKGQNPEGAFAVAGGMTLHQAAAKGDAAAINALLSLGADPNELSGDRDFAGLTPLMAACRALWPDAAQALLDGGADPLFRVGETGRTAMYELCTTLDHPVSIPGGILTKARLFETLDLLLKSGGPAGQPADGEGNTALHLLCRSACRSWWVEGDAAHPPMLVRLLDAGADPNRANQSGASPLHCLCAAGGREAEGMATTLLERGADPAARDAGGNTPALLAAALDQEPAALSLIQTLLDFGDPELGAVNNEGKTALDLAAGRGYNALVKLLLSNV